MRMCDIILKKRNGFAINKEEINFFVNGVTDGSIPDYQITAFLMAVYFQGMTDKETVDLTLAMAHSGGTVDLSGINGFKVDKHSTGGVGDKTTLIAAPIVAACGCKVAKLSGRGLGFTGGTIDKLESIPNFNTSIPPDKFIDIVNAEGLCVAAQTASVAPADKRLYALRDVTATVDSIPLIASSIMSKKLAIGSDAILLDVKVGAGAFMKTYADAEKLARAMTAIGNGAGTRTMALITSMDTPLGYAVGNALEIIEVADILRGAPPSDLREVSVRLASAMLYLANKGDIDACYRMADEAVTSGAAYAKFKAMVAAQGGDVSFIEDTALFKKASICREIKALEGGYITKMDAERCGMASVALGAGRETKNSPINHSAGIRLTKKVGDYVNAGDTIALFHTDSSEALRDAQDLFLSGVTLGLTKPNPNPLVLGQVY